jgi:hypothetical protein
MQRVEAANIGLGQPTHTATYQSAMIRFAGQFAYCPLGQARKKVSGALLTEIVPLGTFMEETEALRN